MNEIQVRRLRKDSERDRNDFGSANCIITNVGSTFDHQHSNTGNLLLLYILPLRTSNSPQVREAYGSPQLPPRLSTTSMFRALRVARLTSAPHQSRQFSSVRTAMAPLRIGFVPGATNIS